MAGTTPARSRSKAATIPTDPAPAGVEPTAEPEELELAEPDKWKAVNRHFTYDEVRELLEKLPPWWGVEPVKYLDHVVGIPNQEKVKVKQRSSSGGEVLVDRHVMVTTLYVAVSGRVMALQDAQQANDWEVDFEPEPTSTPAGYLELNADRIIHREYVTVRYWDLHTTTWRVLARRPGTAWAKRVHGSAPQMAETAARGRAISGLGIGVLPGSGIASADEMRLAAANLGGGGEPPTGETGQQQRGGSRQRRSRDDLIREVLLLADQYRDVRGEDELVKWTGLALYAQKHYAVDIAVESDDGGNVLAVDLTRLTDGHLTMMRNNFTTHLARARGDVEQES